MTFIDYTEIVVISVVVLFRRGVVDEEDDGM